MVRKPYVLEQTVEMTAADGCWETGTRSALLEKSRRSLYNSIQQDGNMYMPQTNFQFYRYNSILLLTVTRGENIAVLGPELVIS